MKKLWLVNIFLIGILAGTLGRDLIMNNINNTGAYTIGKVTIWPDRTVNYDEYVTVGMHEYIHYVYDKLLDKDDINEWKKIVDKTGYHSGYPKVETNWHRYNEELAECTTIIIRYNETCSPEEDKFIKEHIFRFIR